MNAYEASLLAATFILVSPSMLGQDGSDVEGELVEVPYQIIVTPQATRRDLRQLIVEVTDDLIARFNELNLDDDYDISCYKFRPTMSHIRKRVCEPVFLTDARSENAQEVARTFATGGFAWLLNHWELRSEKIGDYEILEEKFDEFIRTDEELDSIAYVLVELKARLENYGKDL